MTYRLIFIEIFSTEIKRQKVTFSKYAEDFRAVLYYIEAIIAFNVADGRIAFSAFASFGRK